MIRNCQGFFCKFSFTEGDQSNENFYEMQMAKWKQQCKFWESVVYFVFKDSVDSLWFRQIWIVIKQEKQVEICSVKIS